MYLWRQGEIRNLKGQPRIFQIHPTSYFSLNTATKWLLILPIKGFLVKVSIKQCDGTDRRTKPLIYILEHIWNRRDYLFSSYFLQNYLNKGTAYSKRVVGNHPHMIPLYEHLNQDIHSKVNVHTVLTKHLHKDDPLKFSKRTPDCMQKAYLKLWYPSLGPDEGAPTSKHIQEDMKRVIN